VNAAGSLTRTDPCVIRRCATRLAIQAGAPHARFSFQRTSTRPSRRTSNVVLVGRSVKPPGCLVPFKERPASRAGTHFIKHSREAVKPMAVPVSHSPAERRAQ